MFDEMLHKMNSSFITHPLALPAPIQLGGPPIIKKFLFGNTNIGGTVFPKAETAVTTLTLILRSPEDMAATLSSSLAVTILFGFITVDNPHSIFVTP